MNARSIRILGLALAAFALLEPIALRPVAAAGYTVVELTTSPDHNNTARRVNDSGHAAGRSEGPFNTDTRAFLWMNSDGESLGVLPGGESSHAFGVNNSGAVVGCSNIAASVRAFRWTRSAGMEDLGTLPDDSSSVAFDVSDSGNVVGYSSGGGGVRAFLWTNNGGMESLGALPGHSASEAYGINNPGWVVGFSGGPGGTRAFIWTRGRGLEDLGTLPGDTDSRALGINERGDVVGSSSGPGGTRAVLWRSGGEIRNLGTLPGGDYSEGLGINNSGRVVGGSTSPLGSRAFLWTGEGGLQDLNDSIDPGSGVVLTQALDINEQGQILALGYRAGGSAARKRHGDEDHGHERPSQIFLLSPNQGGGIR